MLTDSISRMEREVLDAVRPWAARLVASLAEEAGGDAGEWRIMTYRQANRLTGATVALRVSVEHHKPGEIPVTVLDTEIGPTLEQTKPRFIRAMRKALRKAYPDTAPKSKLLPWFHSGSYWLGVTAGIAGAVIGQILARTF